MDGLAKAIADHDVAVGLVGLVIVLLAVIAGFHRSARKAGRNDR